MQNVNKSAKPQKTPKNKGGRPSLSQQQKLDEELWEYYQTGYSAQFTSIRTGHDWKTVQDRFRKWTNEFIDKTDFFEQQKEAKVRLIVSLDGIIQKLQIQLRTLNNTRTKNFDSKLENTILDICQILKETENDKVSTIITPTLDISLKKLLKEKYDLDLHVDETGNTQ